MSYDSWLQPPDPVFGRCVTCSGSEEDHQSVSLDMGDAKPEAFDVCANVADLALAIEADYPFELVYPDSADDTDNALVTAYENATSDIYDNLYDEDDEDGY